MRTYAKPASVPVAKSVGRDQAPAPTTHKPFSVAFVCPIRRTRFVPLGNVTPSIVGNPLNVSLETLAATAGTFGLRGTTDESTYALVATSVGLVVVPSMVIM